MADESGPSLVGRKRGREDDADDAGGRSASSAAVAHSADGSAIDAKRSRADEEAADKSGALISYGATAGKSSALIVSAPPPDPLAARGGRTSNLESSTMLLEGHSAAVLGVAFHPSGKVMASCSRDGKALLWHVYGETDNFGVLSGHKNAVTDVVFSAGAGVEPGGDVEAGSRLYTSSADGTAGVWDVESGVRVRTLAGHGKCVNAVAVPQSGPELLATAGDDGFVRLWDCRSRVPAHAFADRFPLLSVAMAGDGSAVYAAGTEGVIKQWDARRGGAPTMRLEGHREAVTGLSLSPDGFTLLSFGMDNALRAWDVRPFFAGAAAAAAGGAAGGSGADGSGSGSGSGPKVHLGVGVSERCVKLFAGASNNFEQQLIRCAWSPGAGDRVLCGSADRMAYVWEYDSGKLLYALPGHSGE